MLKGLSVVVLTLAAATAQAQVLDVRNLRPAQISALDRSRTVVLLSGGILEEHGPFLPPYSDGYQTEYVAAQVADAVVSRPGWAVLRFPPIPLGAQPANEIGGRFSFPGSFGIRSTTLRAVFMDLVTDVGEAGFKWGFVINLHGSPAHNLALDEAARYFSDTFAGRMVHLSGLASVAGAVPRDLFSPAQRDAEGLSVHADADEHSRVLFLRPDLVSTDIVNAPPVVGRSLPDLVALAKEGDWPGYFGTPAIATAAAGARAMRAIAQAAVDAALKILDGAPDSAFPRVADQVARVPDLQTIVDALREHEQRIEQRQNDWLSSHTR